MNESLHLADYVTRTCYDDIMGDAVAITKWSILDAVGVMLAASTLGEGCRAFIQLALEEEGKQSSTVIGVNAKTSPTMAAFANGAMAHALDFEDAHEAALVHPNAATIPAALAVAESIGKVSGKQFIAAVALGCDLVCRLGLALNEDLLKYGWYMPPILGAFGATAAAGKLLHLTTEQMLDAFSLTLSQAACSGELANSSHSVVRSIRDAFPAKAGVVAALLAQKGITGFDQPFEGKLGLYTAYARGNYDPAKLTRDLGQIFEGRNVSFKAWPSCRGTHPYVDATLQMRRAHGLGAADIQAVHVVVSTVNAMLCEPVAVKQKPATAIDAKFSIPFVVASALVHGPITLDTFTRAAITDDTVLNLASKFTYEVDSHLTRAEAAKGELRIETTHGVLTRPVDVAYGHPSNPIGETELLAKFANCANYAAKGISPMDANRLADLILNLETVSDVCALTESL
ncbi:MAG TPA: MmgE/PrpD family protein [Anaerolineae bacterium]